MVDFLKNVIKGKSIYRILFQKVVYRHRSFIRGNVLDLGAGANPSYYRYLDCNDCVFTKTDYVAKQGVDAVVDFTEPFPFSNESFDTVCIFHALYIAPDPANVLQEVCRVLKREGILVIAMPFVANEMPEPHDYHRYTAEGLDLLLKNSGFSPIIRERIGERFSAAAYIISPFLYIWPLKLPVYAIALLFDRLIPRRLKHAYPFPIGYLYVSKKQ